MMNADHPHSTGEASQARTLDGARIVVGVTAGIAAYKTALIVRGLTEAGAQVQVVPTPASLEFVGAATWEALSHHPVHTSVFESIPEVEHVQVGQQADLILIAPATADFLARARIGRADDLLTATLLVARAPVVLAPAMHTEMWEHPATQDNVRVLRARGIVVLPPDSGRLTGADTGPGRLPHPDAIVAAAHAAVTAPRDDRGCLLRDFAGTRVLITAGGTREDIDPVRYFSNHSSGRQGWALAHAAAIRGAEVTVVAANVDLPAPAGVTVVPVTSAAEMAAAVAERREHCDLLIMAAAVADFTPADRAEAKIKKTDDDAAPVITLERTEDILLASVRARGDVQHPKIVGFAAETGSDQASAAELAGQKARRKGADLLVFNDVTGEVFGSDRNQVSMLSSDGSVVGTADGTKTEVAQQILTVIAARNVS